MLSRFNRLTGILVLLASLILGAHSPAQAAERTSFNVAWSIYVGWMPWDFADRSGILKKWADKYGIKIKLTQVNEYVESINQYTAGSFDACVMTNMDMLTIPAAGGVDSTALIVGDFSNGNDGVVLKGKGKTLADIKGQKVNLVELSVSHYLLARGLSSVGLRERDLKIINTSDADIVAAFGAPETTAVVTWKPQLSAVLAAPNAQLVFDSSKIPGEILDLLVIKTDVLNANPKLGKALVGAWYETLAVMFRQRCRRPRRADGHGQGLRHGPGRICLAARHHAYIRNPRRCVRVRDIRRHGQEHGPGAQVLLRARNPRTRRELGRRHRNSVPGGQDARRYPQSQNALRCRHHEARHGRKAVSAG